MCQPTIHLRVVKGKGSRGRVESSAARDTRARGPGPWNHGAQETFALDTQALDRFLAGVERRAFRIAEIGTGSREDALDIVQEAMLKLAERYAARDASEWRPLFYRILNSRIMDWHRRRKVRSRWRVWLRAGPDDEFGDPLESQPDTREPGPERRAAQARTLDSLDEAVKSLPPRQRQALLLRLWEGMDVADAARAMRCSQGSVKTHYSRAVHALRAKLEPHYGD